MRYHKPAAIPVCVQSAITAFLLIGSRSLHGIKTIWINISEAITIDSTEGLQYGSIAERSDYEGMVGGILYIPRQQSLR
ncbi:hypothetical protein N7539_008209 [Penicillium diatomitis]|uniref:Uncharacterized protein n=1 Tax=Penicillium diatomitis TaxID=2819901 RepID=A0A9W9WTE9_9EURO|nr:uncharacterized protein N7539_008209 [Penicillium diatomitis]KAJ5475143.1 hypothetical protein N7539_008209 [Penicillium diatomitis]